MKRNFRMDKNLLQQVIFDQSGTIEKAILESIQNSVDSGTTECNITIGHNSMIIKDDGKGMTESEITTKFENFGLPQSESKTFGKFRIGRGQIFTLGCQKWHTKDNIMQIDIRNSLDYDLQKTTEKKVNGLEISIDLYPEYREKLKDKKQIQELRYDLLDKIEHLEEICNTKVSVNGHYPITSRTFKTFETRNAIFHMRESSYPSQSVFNMGIYVTTENNISPFTAHIVSKRQLTLNQARNQIKDNCKIWNQIKKDLETINSQMLSNTSPDELSESGKGYVSSKILSNPSENKNLHSWKVFKLSNGNYCSFNQIKDAEAVSFAKSGNPIADRMMQLSRKIFVLDQFAFRSDYEYDTIQQYAKDYFPDIDQLAKDKDLDLGHKIISRDSLSKRETKRLRRMEKVLQKSSYEKWSIDQRELKVCESFTTHGFTDGSSFIAVNRNILDAPKKDFLGMAIHILAHESAHSNDSFNSNIHGPEFYQRFHEFSETIAKFGLYLITSEKYIN